MKKLLLLILFISPFALKAQNMSIEGNVQDTVAKIPLKNAVAMIVKLKDSTLLAFTRTNENGYFSFKNIKMDTVLVLVTHPLFSDLSFYVFASNENKEFNFGKVVLPPKSQQLNEVVIYAYKDPVYYKGDTLVYTADSFKTKPNATVEDLLRRLPGVKVDAAGKITSQGKEVSQVLVDGDEFFGTDPTVATKNLTAKGVESVQVYEKKNEEATDGGDETIQVMNLKMKEDAKKGYFGKVSGASDFQKYYEGEVLANKFKGSQKVSVFALGSNTPRSSFGWGDMYKYGLDNEMNMSEDDEGNRTWYNKDNGNTGVPQTFKSGFYFNDKLSKKTKLNLNYSYNNNQLLAASTTRSQYFLSDTSYITENGSSSKQNSQSHIINLKINHTIDSLTEIEIRPKLQVNSNNTNSSSLNLFKTATDTVTRVNDIENKNKAKGYDLSANVRLVRKFKKKDRQLTLNYSLNNKDDESEGYLFSNNTYYYGIILPNDSVNQRKENASSRVGHNARVIFTEPISKKSKIEFDYNFNINTNYQNKKTYNFFNGEYSVNDSILSNEFENITYFHKAGLKYIYETKKIVFVSGVKGQQNELKNDNKVTAQITKYNTSALLPFLTYMYKFSDNSRLRFEYNTKAMQPNVNQLQPVQDNTNPNRIIIGNPSLKPSYNNHFGIGYNLHKPISGKYVWSNLNFDLTNNAFGNSTEFDSLGRTISQTINVNGNYNGNFYISAGLPLFSKLIVINPEISGYVNKNTNIINKQNNITKSSSLSFDFEFALQADSVEFSIGAGYDINQTQSTLNASSNKPYSSQQYYGGVAWLIPFKFIFEAEVEYNINSQRTQGYNINYLLLDAKLSKAFLKNDNFIITLEANDILNQNINTNRSIQDNVITDSKTNIISRYFLLRATYKFNSTKTKDEDYDW